MMQQSIKINLKGIYIQSSIQFGNTQDIQYCCIAPKVSQNIARYKGVMTSGGKVYMMSNKNLSLLRSIAV